MCLISSRQPFLELNYLHVQCRCRSDSCNYKLARSRCCRQQEQNTAATSAIRNGPVNEWRFHTVTSSYVLNHINVVLREALVLIYYFTVQSITKCTSVYKYRTVEQTFFSFLAAIRKEKGNENLLLLIRLSTVAHPFVCVQVLDICLPSHAVSAEYFVSFLLALLLATFHLCRHFCCESTRLLHHVIALLFPWSITGFYSHLIREVCIQHDRSLFDRFLSSFKNCRSDDDDWKNKAVNQYSIL